MSWCAKLGCLLITALLLQGCGFQPVYGEVQDDHIEVGSYLASTEVRAKGGSDLVNQLKMGIEDRINPKAQESLYGPSFQLEITLRTPRTPLGIGRSGAISRYDITLDSRYRLIDLDTKQELTKGVIQRRVSYFNADEKFAAYSAEQDAIRRGVKELAEDYKMRLASYYAQYYKLSTVAE